MEESAYTHEALCIDDDRVVCQFEHEGDILTTEVISREAFIMRRTSQRNLLTLKHSNENNL